MPVNESEMVGFFCYTAGWYIVVILDKTRPDPKRSAKAFVEEYRAESPQALIAVCEEAGYDIGTAAHVQELCQSAPSSTVRRLH